MQNNNFDITNHSYAHRALQRSRADGISLFLYDKRDGGNVMFLHQQNTLPEAMLAYRQRLHRHDSFLQDMAKHHQSNGAFVALKVKNQALNQNSPALRNEGVYWKGLGGFGYEATACMAHALSSNLYLAIGIQMTTRNRYLQMDQALNTLEEWLTYGQDFIVEQSLDVLRDNIIEPGDRNELQQAIATATKREQQVICEILKGRSNKEIADVLSLSYYTVENHLRRIYKKFGVHSRAALIAAIRV